MKIETREPLKRWVSLIVENVLPRGLRQQYMDESAEYCSSLSQFVPDSAVNIAGGYWIQAIAAFNKTLALAQTGAVRTASNMAAPYRLPNPAGPRPYSGNSLLAWLAAA